MLITDGMSEVDGLLLSMEKPLAHLRRHARSRVLCPPYVLDDHVIFTSSYRNENSAPNLGEKNDLLYSDLSNPIFPKLFFP
jgi:hypothetical protein